MSANALVLLRFHDENGGPSPVTPKALSDLIQAIEQSLGTLLPTTAAMRSVQLLIGLSPRRGCLEIPFLAKELMAVTVPPGWTVFDVLGAVVDSLTLLQLAYGRGGAFEWAVKARKNQSADLGEVPLRELKLRLNQAVAENSMAAANLLQVIKVAGATGAHRVEIVVADEDPVLLFTYQDRSQPAILATATARMRFQPPVAEVTISRADPVVGATFRSQPAQLLMVKVDDIDHESAAVWVSSIQPQPLVRMPVRAKWLQLDDLKDLELKGPVSDQLENGHGVLLIEAVQAYV